MSYKDLFDLLEKSKNDHNALKMSSYMKNNFPFLGINKPELEKISKTYINSISKNKNIDWEFINICWDKNYREAQYIALDYIQKISKRFVYNDIDKIKNLILKKSWWDTSDALDKIIGYISINDYSAHREMLKWSVSDNLWLRRVSINYQRPLKEKTNTDILENIICNNFDSKEFFINKAIGWILREYSKTNPDWVRYFIEKYKDKLSKLSIREASKYI